LALYRNKPVESNICYTLWSSKIHLNISGHRRMFVILLFQTSIYKFIYACFLFISVYSICCRLTFHL
jgi:hypothetical protein